MQHFLNNLIRVALWERAQRIRYKVYRNNIIRVALWKRAQRIRDKIYLRIFRDWFEQEKMLADNSRVKAYAKAIERYIEPGSTVLDLGTGTGVLAFMAARAGAQKVYAVEHAEIIETARLVASHNGIFNVEFLRVHSKKVTLPDRVDFIVQEQMGPVLDNENMIANVVDLRDRLLKPNGKILPNKFQMFAEPVQLCRRARVPFLWENVIDGIDFSCLRSSAPKPSPNYCYRKIQPADVELMLSDPEPLFEFDLEKVHVGEIPLTYDYRRRVARNGSFDGICFYFIAAFDEEIKITTHPQAGERPTSWSTFLYRMPARSVSEGDIIQFELTIRDLKWHGTWEWRPID